LTWRSNGGSRGWLSDSVDRLPYYAMWSPCRSPVCNPSDHASAAGQNRQTIVDGLLPLDLAPSPTTSSARDRQRLGPTVAPKARNPRTRGFPSVELRGFEPLTP